MSFKYKAQAKVFHGNLKKEVVRVLSNKSKNLDDLNTEIEFMANFLFLYDGFDHKKLRRGVDDRLSDYIYGDKALILFEKDGVE